MTNKKIHMLPFIREHFGRIKDFQTFLGVTHPTATKFVRYPQLMSVEQVVKIMEHLGMSADTFYEKTGITPKSLVKSKVQGEGVE